MIVLLRQSGAAVGWGFQLQNLVAVAGFSLLIFAVGLNLSGVFEVGSIALGDSLANRTGTLGAFRIEFGWKRATCNNQEQ